MLELFQNVIGAGFFETQCSYYSTATLPPKHHKFLAHLKTVNFITTTTIITTKTSTAFCITWTIPLQVVVSAVELVLHCCARQKADIVQITLSSIFSILKQADARAV